MTQHTPTPKGCLVCGKQDAVLIGIPGRFLYPGRIAALVCHQRVPNVNYTYQPVHKYSEIEKALTSAQAECDKA